VARREPAAAQVGAPDGRLFALGGLAEVVVRVDDQRREQRVAALEVAVHGRGHHAELARDRAQ
jgi:hypothetical protein